jgi:ABC-type nitrate/sulfonate/bicarbonate transport system permease component
MAGKRWRRVLPPVSAIAGVLLIWQALCAALDIPAWLLPDPWSIALHMAEEAELLFGHVAFTLGLALRGMLLGVAAGVICAFVFHALPAVRAAFSPLLVASQNIPLIALGPLLMIWFGVGILPKLILLVLVCFFPVAWSMLAGLGRSEPQLREYLAMIGASRVQTFFRLELPASLPYFFAGLKLTATYSFLTAMVAEWLGSGRGIGYFLVLQYKGFKTTGVFASIFCIVACSLVLYGLAVLAESWVLGRLRMGGSRVKGGGGA